MPIQKVPKNFECHAFSCIFLRNEEEGIGSYPSEVFCTFWNPLVEEEGWAWSMMMLQLCENVYQANRQMWAIDSDFV